MWLDLGHEVHYVQNVTDVDDPLFERADRDGVDWRELADREIALFREDMSGAAGAAAARLRRGDRGDRRGHRAGREDARRRARPTSSTTPNIPDVYFRADATAQFGYESGYDRDTMLRLFGERGGDPDRPGKSDAARRAAVAGGAAGGAQLAVAVRGWPARLARRVRGDRAQTASAPAWTSRAAAAT